MEQDGEVKSTWSPTPQGTLGHLGPGVSTSSPAEFEVEKKHKPALVVGDEEERKNWSRLQHAWKESEEDVARVETRWMEPLPVRVGDGLVDVQLAAWTVFKEGR